MNSFIQRADTRVVSAVSPYVLPYNVSGLKDEFVQSCLELASKVFRLHLSSRNKCFVGDGLDENMITFDLSWSRFSKQGNSDGLPWVDTFDLMALLVKAKAAGLELGSIQIGHPEMAKSACVLTFVKPLPKSALV